MVLSQGFNPRTHTGCDHMLPFNIKNMIGFNPRTHTGCDRIRINRLDAISEVSIHAPIQGATKPDNYEELKLMFQSTHPYRVRPLAKEQMERKVLVSIHAPIQGATLSDKTILSELLFQSTHPYRVRLDFLKQFSDLNVSIHAPIQGATPQIPA